MSKRKRAERLVGKAIRTDLGYVCTVLGVEVEWDGRSERMKKKELKELELYKAEVGEKKALCLKLRYESHSTVDIEPGAVVWQKLNSRVRYEIVCPTSAV